MRILFGAISGDHFAASSMKEKSGLPPGGALGRFLAGRSGNGNKDIKIPLYVYHECCPDRRMNVLRGSGILPLWINQTASPSRRCTLSPRPRAGAGDARFI